MKKILAIFMILFLMTGTVFAGFDPVSSNADYEHNTQAHLIKGYSKGVDDTETEEVEDVDYMVQIKYSKNIDKVDELELPDVDELLGLMGETYNATSYGAIEVEIDGIVVDDEGYVILQRHYYTSTPGALMMSYPMGEPPEFDEDEPDESLMYGPYRHVLSYKIVFSGGWKIQHVSSKMYGYEFDDEWVETEVPDSEVLIYEDENLLPGLGRHKGEKTPKIAPISEGINGNKEAAHDFAPGKTGIKPVNYGQSKKGYEPVDPGDNRNPKGKK